MTDEQMDARLRAAGARWRETNAGVAVSEPVVAERTEAATLRRPAKKWGLLASAAVVAAALVVGGTFVLRDVHDSPAPSGDAAALEGHVWLLDGKGATASLYIDRDGNLVADDECRLIGGHAAIDGNAMTVSGQVVRDKSCTDQYGPGFYDAGTAVLDGASTYRISSNALTITRNGKDLRFTLAPPNTPVPSLDFPTLVDTQWQLLSATDATGAAVPVTGASTLKITHSGALTATDRCDTVRADATVAGPSMKLDDIVTGDGCTGSADGTAGSVRDFFAAGTIRQLTVGGELALTRGKAQLVYRWQPQDTAATDPAQLPGVTWHLVDNAGTAVPLGTTVRFTGSNISGGGSGCDPVTADIAPGTFRVTGSSTGTPTSGSCSATPLYDFLAGDSHTWRVADGHLIVFTGAQADALVFADTTTPPPVAAPLVGPTWHLTSITTSHDVRYRNGAPPAEDSTLHFTARGFAVQHVCYTQEGTARATTTTVTFSGGHLVRADPCPFQPGRDDAAQVVDSILTGTVNWSINSGTLTLHDAAGTLVYSQSPTRSDDKPLAGTPWRLETVVTDQGKTLPATGQTLTVDASNHLVADDGSNAINAQVTARDGVLTLADVAVGGVGSTRDDPVRDTIDQVLAQGDAGYGIAGDALTITRGAAQLIYRASRH